MTAPTLTTARLRLRPPTMADAAPMAERRSDPETAQYQAWPQPYTVQKAERMVAGLIEQGGPARGCWYQWVLERVSDGEVVGDIAFRLDADGHNGEVGYVLWPWARGHGYATEGAAAAIEYGFTEWGLHRIEAELDPRNVGSIRVLERLGFRHEGDQIEAYWVGDTVTDSGHYGLLRREWEAMRAGHQD